MDLTAIVVALIATIGTIVVAAIQARHKSGDPATAAKWRNQAELQKARADLLEEQLEDERSAKLIALETMRAAERDLDTCVRQRDAAFSDLRAMERRRRPRPTA